MEQVVLNVGSGDSRDLPEIYAGWRSVTLDIDEKCRPDIVQDARKLRWLPGGTYDAVYTSHCLEHFHEHEVRDVLGGFAHVLNAGGFAHVIVPDMAALFEAVVHGNRDIEDMWYVVSGCAIRFLDVIYGWQKQVASGNEYYAHKTGFTSKSLAKAMKNAGFVKVLTAPDGVGNIHAFGFKGEPDVQTLIRLGI